MDKKDATPGYSQEGGRLPEMSVPVEASFQRTLLPLEVINTYPWTGDNAHLKQIIEARDGQHYGVKISEEDGRAVPASELFCHELAARLLIPTPGHAVIKMPSGKLAFGSLWQGGVIEKKSPLEFQMFIDQILRGEIKVTNVKKFFSRLYAFDLFVNNVDRGWKNYLWRTSFGDSVIGLAFDFSRACFETGHEGAHAMAKHTNTQSIFTMINRSKNYERSEAAACLDAIKAITTDEIRVIFSAFPAEWMSTDEKIGYIQWWDSRARLDRIEMLHRFI